METDITQYNKADVKNLLHKVELSKSRIAFLEHKLEICRLELEMRDKEIKNVIKQNDIILNHEREVKELIDSFKELMNIIIGRQK